MYAYPVIGLKDLKQNYLYAQDSSKQRMQRQYLEQMMLAELHHQEASGHWGCQTECKIVYTVIIYTQNMGITDLNNTKEIKYIAN